MITRKRLPSLLNRVLWCRTRWNISDLNSDLEGIYLATKNTSLWWVGQRALTLRSFVYSKSRTKSRAVADRVVDEVLRRRDELHAFCIAPTFTGHTKPTEPEPTQAAPVAPKKETDA